MCLVVPPDCSNEQPRFQEDLDDDADSLQGHSLQCRQDSPVPSSAAKYDEVSEHNTAMLNAQELWCGRFNMVMEVPGFFQKLKSCRESI